MNNQRNGIVPIPRPEMDFVPLGCTRCRSHSFRRCCIHFGARRYKMAQFETIPAFSPNSLPPHALATAIFLAFSAAAFLTQVRPETPCVAENDIAYATGVNIHSSKMAHC
jgi:hypothetical protein